MHEDATFKMSLYINICQLPLCSLSSQEKRSIFIQLEYRNRYVTVTVLLCSDIIKENIILLKSGFYASKKIEKIKSSVSNPISLSG